MQKVHFISFDRFNGLITKKNETNQEQCDFCAAENVNPLLKTVEVDHKRMWKTFEKIKKKSELAGNSRFHKIQRLCTAIKTKLGVFLKPKQHSNHPQKNEIKIKLKKKMSS